MKRLKHLPLLLALLSTFRLVYPSSAASPSIMSQPMHYQASFLHATGASGTTDTNSRKRSHSTSTLFGLSEGDDVNDKLVGGNTNSGSKESGAQRKRTKPPRRNSPQRSPRIRKGKTNYPRVAKTGPSNIMLCPPLNGPAGAPQLPVLTTKDPTIIEKWLDEHVGVVSNDGDGDASNGYAILGFDSESIAKPPWRPERASLPDGPATIQLSTPASCLIVQLSICGDGSARHAPDVLRRRVINNPRIIKVGVGIDDDALEMYRWSKESFGDAEEEGGRVMNQEQQQKKPQLWEMTSRFDLGCILPDKHPSRRSGLRELAQKIIGVDINKSKKLAMSNWGKRRLSIEQISYAARDAWVSAAILERLQEGNSGVFNAGAIMEMEFIKTQREMEFVDERAKLRKAAKLELQELMEGRGTVKGGTDADKEERRQQLNGLLDLHRPDQPPAFDEHVFTLPLF